MMRQKRKRMISKCCLFIDNDSFHQSLFTEALNDLAPETLCLTAANGLDGLYMMMKERVVPSYIFIELNLPKMGAMEFLRQVKQQESLREIPVIVHSSHPQPNEVLELKELGAHAIYFRPYEYHGICNMLMLYFTNEIGVILPN
jgi:CheY-like chemotaxis protein